MLTVFLCTDRFRSLTSRGGEIVPRIEQDGTSTRFGRRRLLVSGIALVALVGATVLGASSAMGESTAPSAIKVGEFPLPGGDLQNTRNIPGPINSSNVSKL